MTSKYIGKSPVKNQPAFYLKARNILHIKISFKNQV